MEENAEVDERVDFEDNYMEEEDEDADEQVDVDGVDGGGDANGEENHEHEDLKAEEGQTDLSVETEKDHGDSDQINDEESPSALLSEEEKEKHAQLLALPPHGSEVFIGGIPKDTTEEDLRELCEPIGEIFEVRLMRDRDSGESKGYAFVAFKSKDLAQTGIEQLHGKEFKGKTLRCSLSETKNRLFIGNVPKSWSEDEFRRVIESAGPGIENIELIKDPLNPIRNRGFAFVLYYNNACADYSRQKMSSASFKLEGNTPTVTWADPKSSPDHSATSQVKALYIKNIPENVSTEKLKELFQHHGEVTKVVMPPSKAGKRDFGFVHFADRSSALKAVKDTEKYEIDGHALEVVLAKPQTDRKGDAAYPYGAGFPPNALGGSPYGFAGSAYGSVSPGYGVSGALQQQPVIYGRGPMPSGMHMVPMVLPDGRIGYVLQQPGVQMQQTRPPRRGDRGAGPGGRSGSSSGDGGSRGRRYRPY